MTDFEPNSNIEAPIPPLRKGSIIGDQDLFEKRLNRRLKINFDYYLFTALFLLILAAAVFFDSLPLYILAVLFAPLQSPIITFCFNLARKKYERWINILVGGVFNLAGVFGVGALVGLIVQQFPERSSQVWLVFTNFTWAHILLVFVGSGLTFFIIQRNPNQNVLVANIAILYGLYLPVLAAGVDFSNGNISIFYQSMLNYMILLSVSLFFGILTIKLSNPTVSLKRTTILLGIIFVGALVLGYIKYLPVGFSIKNSQTRGDSSVFTEITATPSPTATETEVRLPTLIKTDLLQPTNQVVVKSATATIPATITPTVTITPVPTPLWAEIRAEEGQGANIRENPEFSARIVRTVLNGTLVEILPETVEVDGNTWIHVRLEDQTEGWIIRNLILAATPAPEW